MLAWTVFARPGRRWVIRSLAIQNEKPIPVCSISEQVEGIQGTNAVICATMLDPNGAPMVGVPPTRRVEPVQGPINFWLPADARIIGQSEAQLRVPAGVFDCYGSKFTRKDGKETVSLWVSKQYPGLRVLREVLGEVVSYADDGVTVEGRMNTKSVEELLLFQP